MLSTIKLKGGLREYMNSKNVILEVRGIQKSFGATKALKGVDMDIYDNEIHAIVGSNGAGKSTLMKMLAGIYVPDAGKIIFQGEDITGLSPLKLQKKGIQVVHQVLNIVESMSVLENILLSAPPVQKGILNWKKDYEKVTHILEILDFPLDLKIPAGQLSVSEQQFIILARALVNGAKVLILDEPTARLSLEETNKLFAVIRRLKEQGTTIIYISHRMEEIYTISDRISVFRDGVCVTTRDTKDFSGKELVKNMLGKEMDVFFPEKKAVVAEPLLEIEGLAYQNKLFGVDICVHKGEIVSVIGAVGSGQTELVNAVYGMLSPDKGIMKLNGKILPNRHSPNSSIRKGIALIPEDRASQGMIGDFNIKNNITSIRMSQISNGGVLSRKKEEVLSKEMVEKLNVRPADIHYIMNQLSGGNQQKVVIGKWMTTSYQLYLMAEVTSGVDIGAKAEIYKLMEELVAGGSAVLLSTGDIEEALGISDRIIVLYKGKVVLETTPAETTKDVLLTYIMGGTVNEG